MPCRSLLTSLTVLSFVTSGALAADVASPLSPADAQHAFQLADANLRIELAAAEPEVIDPVAIRFDEDGRMWVAEMRDYPFGPPKAKAPLSRIRVLEDADGDGRFEKSTVFADGLSYVNGLQPWKGGVFVTLSGAVAYMKDTDGDGKCDLDETWFDGFAEENTQLRANHPRLGIDNWIYVANGLRGGKIVSRKLPDQQPIDISGRDFRFDPFTGKAEAVSGNGQFGLCFDDWGNRFVCSNRNPCRHVVIEDRYLKANPSVSVPAVVHDVAAAGEESRIFPISRAWTTSNLHAGQFTAACGVHIYRGTALRAEFYGNVFTCDPTGNLVHREIVKPQGPTFTSKPAYEGKEFLASPDEWFRPVNLELGPDGALYVVDMYRCVIEHPDFVPDELKNRPDQRLGDDRGRIWRVASGNTNPKREQGTADTNPKRERGIALSTLSTDDLIPLLGHANAWQRETAQRLLLERERQAAAPKLREAAASAESPQARARSLWLLQGLQLLEVADLLSGLKDDSAEVRRQAMILTEVPLSTERLRGNDLTRATAGLLADDHMPVKFQALLMLAGDKSIPGTIATLPESFSVTETDVENAWQRLALLIFAGPGRASQLLEKWTALGEGEREFSGDELQFLQQVGELALSGSLSIPPDKFSPVRMAAASMRSPNPQVGLALYTGMARRWARGQDLPGDGAKASLPVARLVDLIETPRFGLEVRLQAIALLAFVPKASGTLVPLARSHESRELRIAAIAALARHPGVEIWQELLAAFPSETPPIRRAILDGLLSNPERTKLLLGALEAGKVKPSELDASYVTRLNNSSDAEIKARAGKLFAAATPVERAKALADYQPVLQLTADSLRGRAIFEKNCAVCHKIGDLGVNVAPDISDTRTKQPEQLLADILQPNRAIDNNYLGYSVRLVDGTVSTGILSAETATSITLRQQGGKEAVIPRTEIDELKSSGVSLMPEGLERQIPHQEMADLISFLKNWRYLDGKTPLSPAGP
jgi:putative membrane-bound dehydrogenase-like protein